MEQFSIHIHANNSSTSVEFVEKNYKLNAGETLVGKDDDFPVKKNLSYFTDWETMEGEISSLKPSTTEVNRKIVLTTWLNTVFPSIESLPDKGITVEIDFFFFMNHWTEMEVVESSNVHHHYSLTANALTRFQVFKTNLNTYYFSNFQTIVATGKWVKYGVDTSGGKSTPYNSILSHGTVFPAITPASDPASASKCFVITPNTTTTSAVEILLENILQENSSFQAAPDYDARVMYKIRAFNYDQADHTYEYIRI